MGHLGPLRSALFRLRKRKKISLDGVVGGLEVNRYRSRLGYADPGHHFSPSPVDPYDPDPGPMEDHSPEYHQPNAWFDQHFPGTPQERFRGEPQEHAEHLSPEQMYEKGMVAQNIMEQMMQEMYQTDARADLTQTDNLSAPRESGIDGTVQDPIPDYDACQMTNELFEQQMQQLSEPFENPEPQPEQAEPEPEPQPGPEPDPDPYMLQQQQFDQMMQYMVDPFQMPGPMG